MAFLEGCFLVQPERLARGYTALGDAPGAIKSWELALQHVPEDQNGLFPVIENALKKGDSK